jgi:hypothetical protein
VFKDRERCGACEQELAMMMTCVAASSELGWSWRSRKRAAGEGNTAGVGKERRVESTRAGGAAWEELERRWAVLSAGGRGGSRAEVPEEEEGREGV